jgi:hypothetical protein
MILESPRATSESGRAACLEFRPLQLTWRFMRSRSSIWIGILIGSTIGGLIPGLWGDGVLSHSSVLLSGVGAFVGLWIGFKMSG